MKKRLMAALALGALMGALLPGLASATEAEAKASCKDGGWQALVRSDGTAFKNQGECVSYAARGHTPSVPTFQIACQGLAGTYSPGGIIDISPFITLVPYCGWADGVYVTADDWNEVFAVLHPYCDAVGYQYFDTRSSLDNFVDYAGCWDA